MSSSSPLSAEALPPPDGVRPDALLEDPTPGAAPSRSGEHFAEGTGPSWREDPVGRVEDGEHEDDAKGARRSALSRGLLRAVLKEAATLAQQLQQEDSSGGWPAEGSRGTPPDRTDSGGHGAAHAPSASTNSL